VDADQAREFVRTHHRAVLATRKRSGEIQMSPVGATVDADGRVIVSSREMLAKVKNLRRDPRASICVFADDSYQWVQVDGTVEIVSLPEAMELLVDYYRRIAGEHPDWDDYRAAMEREQRVLIRIPIEHAAGPG
jgi:PPOX class probable F420-dependent enzyme